MNRILAETLNFLNGIIAIVIILVGALSGYRLFPAVGSPPAFSFGLVIGIVIAALVCGMIAYVALIERHLARISSGSGRVHVTDDRQYHRQEPSL